MSGRQQNFDATCWTLIQGAAAGARADREVFARRYVSVVRAYLAHRWRGSPLASEVEDAVQEVFLECFREGGVLDRIRADRPASFRAFLYGVARNVAFRCERRVGRQSERHAGGSLEADEVAADEATMSRVFDRAWAQALMRQAATLQEERARDAGEEAVRRVEILRLRASEGLPVREIARLWSLDAAYVHKQYARARQEFRDALVDALQYHHPGATAAEIDDRCREMLALSQGS